MKKCASCTKDLPDAALHCVFCGAKQAPAPATAGGSAKTVMGAYSASDMLEHLKQQSAAPRAHPPSAAPGYRPNAGGYPPAPAPPASAATAATMIVPGPPQAPFNPGGAPQPAPYPSRPGPSHAPTLHAPSPPNHARAPAPAPPAREPMPPPPMARMPPVAAAVPRYVAAQTAPRAGRPIEPWKAALRLVMFVWGGVLLAAFATPLSLDPLRFHWDAIASSEGTAKLPPLIMAAVGFLAIVVAAIPMAPAPRGMLAALLGLAGILVPILIHGMPPWQLIATLAGLVLLIPTLFVRAAYRDATLPRVLITIGVLASVAPFLVPVDGRLMLVELVQRALDAPGAAKVAVLLSLGMLAVVVMTLLAWLPAPSGGGAKPFAWLLIMWPVIAHGAALVVLGDVPGRLESSPYNTGMAWVAGGVGSMGFGVAYAVLVGYGLATVIAKKLE